MVSNGTDEPKKAISAWHSKTLERDVNEKAKLTVGELRTLLWALYTALFSTGRNTRDIDYEIRRMTRKALECWT